MKKYLVISLLASASLLSACGGGDDYETIAAAAGETPASASASSSGLVAYLTEWSLGDANTQTQVSVASFAPPTPDNTSPELVK